ncbi:adenosylcobinamide-GDP ribazoletransferase [Aureimonas psammosilenae]|uniref:adenosylcobinamide-GDP ribazoletransferase n=1 Tax=Aureimonas psammosilenae TaxID=2495496 RepID=UPI001869A08D|nr:adenosylcobinamide-GDP ribazoletransferase [Aureimonas psammosilenae]
MMRQLLPATLRALGFLTRLPIPPSVFAEGRPLGADAHAFPLAGLAAALPSAILVLLGAALGLSPTTTAVGAMTLLVMLTGALHEDGLADVADGLFGHKPKERALLIMKDSRIGAYGALALVFSVLLRVSLLADLLATSAEAGAVALLLVAGFSRGLMVWLWSSLPSADPNGLAARVGAPDGAAGRLSAAIGTGILVLPVLVLFGLGAALLPVALAALAILAFRGFLLRRLGGQTGDCLGAGQQIAEIAALLGFVLAIR